MKYDDAEDVRIKIAVMTSLRSSSRYLRIYNFGILPYFSIDNARVIYKKRDLNS
jgi:hypothetical protein